MSDGIERGGSVRPYAESRGKGVRLQVEPEGRGAMVWKWKEVRGRTGVGLTRIF